MMAPTLVPPQLHNDTSRSKINLISDMDLLEMEEHQNLPRKMLGNLSLKDISGVRPSNISQMITQTKVVN